MSDATKKWLNEHSAVEACHVALVTKSGEKYTDDNSIRLEVQRFVFDAVTRDMTIVCNQ